MFRIRRLTVAPTGNKPAVQRRFIGLVLSVLVQAVIEPAG